MAWLKYCIICWLICRIAHGGILVTLDPIVVSTPPGAGAGFQQLYSCKESSQIDGRVHVYHHLFGNGQTIVRWDATDQKEVRTIDQPHINMAIGCFVDAVWAIVYPPSSSFDAVSGFTFWDNLNWDGSLTTYEISPKSMKSVYLGNKHVVFIGGTSPVDGSVVTYYLNPNMSIAQSHFGLISNFVPVPATVLEENISSLIVYLDGTTLYGSALGTVPYSFTETFTTIDLSEIEVFWAPPMYYISLRVNGQLAIMYRKNLEPTALVYDFIGTSQMKNIMVRSTQFPQWHGALLSLQANDTSIFLIGFVNGSKVFNEFIMPVDAPSASGPTIGLDQSDESSFVMTYWNGTSIKSMIGQFGEISVTPITVSPPITIFPPSPGDGTVVIEFNSTTTVTSLTLNNNTVLVITNEAVIEVEDCASLAGKLKYILSQNQYNTLLEEETLDIIVLLTQCANGSFDAIEVIFEGADAACLNFNGEPNLGPSQLTLLVTKTIGDCNSNVVDDSLTTGAIIGIVVGCAAAVVLIIVLALYFSPLSAKIFPYAPRNKT